MSSDWTRQAAGPVDPVRHSVGRARLASYALGLAAFFLVNSTAPSALGCGCDPIPENPRDHFLRADAVFLGRVIAKSDYLSPFPSNWRGHPAFASAYQLRYQVAVTTSWKGVHSFSITVLSGRGGGDCGYPFEVGKSYLVYGEQVGEDLVAAGICGRQLEEGEASGDLAFLAGHRPLSLHQLSSQGRRLMGLAVLSVLAAVAVGAGVALRIARRRRRRQREQV